MYICFRFLGRQCMAAYICTPSTKEAKAGGFLLSVQGHPRQQGELSSRTTQDFIERVFLKNHIMMMIVTSL